MTQRYVAEIDNSGGVNIQANSAPVIVTWGASGARKGGLTVDASCQRRR